MLNQHILCLEVRNLQPFPGDLIYQGRWGQSLRFGATAQNTPIPNPWSDSGEDGDAITIIRNGQYEEETDPWIPQVEDINEDKSSIYLTSTQNIENLQVEDILVKPKWANSDNMTFRDKDGNEITRTELPDDLKECQCEECN